ncbi:MAG TPA: VOC family protein [bacterium]|nr:VOC family protein [bacterium]
MSIRIDRIDHIVLTARDIAKTCDFYERALGMRAVRFGAGGRTALHFGQTKINLHHAGREFEPKAAVPAPGSADFCLITSTPMEAVAAHLRSCGVQVILGPVPKGGAAGMLTSVYCRAPDGNLVEVSSY